MKQQRKNARREAWAALCTAVMQVEYLLERAGGQGSDALHAARRKLESEPAYRWLVSQRAYRDALEAFERRIGRGEAERLELVSAIAYAMDASYPSQPPRRALSAGVRHARALESVLLRHAGGEDDAKLLALLGGYVERTREQLRASGRSTGGRQWRFAIDLAHLLLAGCGAAPPSVVRPLLRLAGPAASAERVAALLARARREARSLNGAPAAAVSTPVLERIAIVATGARRSAGAT